MRIGERRNPANAKLAKRKKIEFKRAEAGRLKTGAIVEIDAIPIGVAIADLEGKILKDNETSRKMFGLKRGEGIGRPVTDFIVKEDVPRALEAIKELIRKGYYREFGCTGVTKGGGKFPLLVDGTVTRDAGGNPSSIILIYRDMIKRKRAEEALQESEEKWRSLVENAPDIIMTVNRDGTILFINRTVPGITPEQAIGTSIYDYIPTEHHDTPRKSIERVFQTGEPDNYELAGVGPHGITSWYASRVGPIKRDGQVVAVTIISTDVTERKRAEEEIKKAEEEKLEANKRRIEELEKLMDAAVGRELELIDLRDRIRTLELKLKEIIGNK